MNEPTYTREQVEAMIRDAYDAGDYACAADEGMRLRPNPATGVVDAPETVEQVIERHLGTTD